MSRQAVIVVGQANDYESKEFWVVTALVSPSISESQYIKRWVARANAIAQAVAEKYPSLVETEKMWEELASRIPDENLRWRKLRNLSGPLQYEILTPKVNLLLHPCLMGPPMTFPDVTP